MTGLLEKEQTFKNSYPDHTLARELWDVYCEYYRKINRIVTGLCYSWDQYCHQLSVIIASQFTGYQWKLNSHLLLYGRR